MRAWNAGSTRPASKASPGLRPAAHIDSHPFEGIAGFMSPPAALTV
eukprot:CAMPEP_0181358506 /NCGR_PEP_ID=MMETSP1106-20121128/5552_1 /TAXON_ID=81844 /ORGANISM="Mantoniella antarctica, Strain SL-175" /LENGTH=45 /DNA_ID= /DNA_START= /DNA_END= /DNA_ORIENTATION=